MAATPISKYGVLAAVVGILLLALFWPDIQAWRQQPMDPRDVFHQNEIRVGLDPSRPPFAFYTPDGDLRGLEVDLSHALAEEIDLPVRFVPLGFDGLYDALLTEQVDLLIAGMEPVFHRDGKDTLYSRHYFNAGLVLVSEGAFEEMSDLPGSALAYEFGSDADALAHRWLRRIAPFELRPYELPTYALDAVRIEEADAALVDAVSAAVYLSEHATWPTERHQITDRWYTVAMRGDRPDIQQVVDDALQVLSKAGTLDALIDQWL